MPMPDPTTIAPTGSADGDAARFRDTGVLSPFPVIDAAQVAHVLSVLEGLIRVRGALPPMLRAKPHLLVPELWDLVQHPAVVGPVTALLGPDVMCFGTSLIWKPAAADLHVSWHQDATHWGLERPEAVTAWLALTPSTRDSGCVLVAPGTQKDVVTHDHPDDPANMLGRKEVSRITPSEAQTLALELAPGEMSIHHALVLHGSAQNRAGWDRIGFAMRFIPADNAQTGGRSATATPVAGIDHGAYEPEVAPEGLLHPAAMRRHAHVLRLGHQIIYGS